MLSLSTKNANHFTSNRVAQRRSEPRFPQVHFLKGRGYVFRSALNQYKAELQAFALGVAPMAAPAIDPDPLVPLMRIASELGVGRRTIGRRIAESQVSEAT
jgi:hypothetical protein